MVWGKEATLINSVCNDDLKCQIVMIPAVCNQGVKVICWYTGFTLQTLCVTIIQLNKWSSETSRPTTSYFLGAKWGTLHTAAMDVIYLIWYFGVYAEQPCFKKNPRTDHASKMSEFAEHLKDYEKFNPESILESISGSLGFCKIKIWWRHRDS